MSRAFWLEALKSCIKEHTPENLVKYSLHKIDYHNKFVNAVTSINPNLIEETNHAKRIIGESTQRNSLAGIPILLKDSIFTQNWITSVGSKELSLFNPQEDAEIVKRLRQAGCILLGKTNVPEYCFDVQTFNPIYGRTNNPYNLKLTCGGSSGGSAVGVALGIVPLAIGSDMAGSLRIPAAYCGVCSIRPTIERIPSSGHIPEFPPPSDEVEPIGTIGAIGQRVEYLQRFMESVLPNDFIRKQLQTSYNIKIGYTTKFDFVHVDYRIIEAMSRFNDTMDRNGIHCQEINPALDYKSLKKSYETFCRPMVASVTSMVSGKQTDYKFNKGDHMRAIKTREKNRIVLDILLNDFDVWIIPVTPSLPFPHNEKHEKIDVQVKDENGNIVIEKQHYWRLISLVTHISVLGNPVVTLPIGMVDGIPVAVQVVGKRGNDEELLAICQLLERILGNVIEEPKITNLSKL